MKDNSWSPWHGCLKISSGCQHCFVFFLDEKHGMDANIVHKSKTKFYYPIAKDRTGKYKLRNGTQVATCFTSDFFIEEADEWRNEAWEIIKKRNDLEFLIPTKRIHRFRDCVPSDWGDGYNNVFICVSAEDQKAIDFRASILIDLPIKKKGLFLSPLLEEVDIAKYLESGEIRIVSVGGESYKGARECNFNWVLKIKNQCEKFNVVFDFHQTGSNFVYNGKRFMIPHHQEYSQAKKAFLKNTDE